MKKRIIFGMLLASLTGFAQQTEVDYAKFGIDTKYDIPKGLAEGDIAPNFKAKNQLGKTVELSALLKRGSVAVVFYRGQWCSFCSKHLAELEAGLEELVRNNIQVVAITPVSEDNVNVTVEKEKLRFHVISDKDLSIMKDYDVDFQVTKEYNNKLKAYMNATVDESNASGESVLPIPATFVIGQDGKVIKRFFDPNYSNRSSVKDIIKSVY